MIAGMVRNQLHERKRKARNSVPSIAMAGCLFVGIVIGFYRENITAGTLIGLGVGLIVMAILRFIIFSKKTLSPDDGSEKRADSSTDN